MTEAEILVNLLLEGSFRDFLRTLPVEEHPTPDEVDYHLYHEPEDDRPEGNFEDPEDVRNILRQLMQGNEWAWCQVNVKAEWTDPDTSTEYVGNAYLGGCSYASREDFMAPGGYYDDMKKEAYDDLMRQVEQDRSEQD